MGSLDALIGERINNLDMKIYHSINNYMVENKYIKVEDVHIIQDKLNQLNYKDKTWVGFEIAAFELNLITEENLIEIINNFRNIEVVSKEEILNMKILFNNFNYELCDKYKFVEYKNHDNISNTMMILASFNKANEVNEMLKRKYSNFKIRYTIPLYIDQILNSQQ